MRFWVREILGGCLMVLGLLFFAWAVLFVNSRQVVEAAILAAIGALIFRSGIHLMKVAVAAQAFLQRDQQTTGARSQSTDSGPPPFSASSRRPQ